MIPILAALPSPAGEMPDAKRLRTELVAMLRDAQKGQDWPEEQP